MASLVFQVLDRHVIHGLADDLAVTDEHGAMSYAELLHESASIAGALANLGVAPGTGLRIDLAPGREQVVAVLACARIGAVPDEGAELRLAGSPPVLHLPDTEVTWNLLIQAGRVDPAPAPAADAEDYAERLRAAYGDIVTTLEAGGTLSL